MVCPCASSLHHLLRPLRTRRSGSSNGSPHAPLWLIQRLSARAALAPPTALLTRRSGSSNGSHHLCGAGKAAYGHGQAADQPHPSGHGCGRGYCDSPFPSSLLLAHSPTMMLHRPPPPLKCSKGTPHTAHTHKTRTHTNTACTHTTHTHTGHTWPTPLRIRPFGCVPSGLPPGGGGGPR